eukprot:1198686-Pyramimonas_sp.AAC.1
MEKQSHAQTDVINMQLRKVIAELDMMHERLEAQDAALQSKASMRRIADMERILQVLITNTTKSVRGRRVNGKGDVLTLRAPHGGLRTDVKGFPWTLRAPHRRKGLHIDVKGSLHADVKGFLRTDVKGSARMLRAQHRR